MGNKVSVEKGGVVEIFEDVIGHQIGNGAIQILERSGNQRIINNYDDVTVELDEGAAAQFAMDLAQMENPLVGTAPTTDEDEAVESEEADQPSVQ